MLDDYYTPEEYRRDEMKFFAVFIFALALPALTLGVLSVCVPSSADMECRYVVTEKEHVPVESVTQWVRQISDGKMVSVSTNRPETWYLRVRSVDTSVSYVVKIDDSYVNTVLVGDEILLKRGEVE